MDEKFKGGDKISIKKRIRKLRKLLQPFLNEYGEPILVHATPSDKLFKKIIVEGKLKVPKGEINKKHLYIEKLLRLYPSIFFSLGFQYFGSYNFKYNLIFDLNLLRKSKYYRKSIGFQCYRSAFRYWEENNPEYIDKLKNKNKICKEVINKYYHQKLNGKKKTIFEFWKIETELIELIRQYPKRNELIKIFKKILKEKYLSYPNSVNAAVEDCKKEYAPEIIVKRDVPLSKNKDFLGFFISGKIPTNVKNILIKNYADKILFDGKRIRKVRYLEDMKKG
jgi:hypothetical protein